MSDKYFLDSNIVIYAHTNVDQEKQKIAQELLSSDFALISTQVLQETMNTFSKKFKHAWPDIETVVKELVSNNFIHVNNEHTLLKAAKVAAVYKYSFYDSLIISAALENNCTILYSEDMNADQVIDNRLTDCQSI
jgi:predicted nucleic acid-binding protein